jgi:hypothetical protein
MIRRIPVFLFTLLLSACGLPSEQEVDVEFDAVDSSGDAQQADGVSPDAPALAALPATS